MVVVLVVEVVELEAVVDVVVVAFTVIDVVVAGILVVVVAGKVVVVVGVMLSVTKLHTGPEVFAPLSSSASILQ